VRARGPAGDAAMGAAARVTSRGGNTRKVRPSAAVRYTGRNDRRDPAAESGGDIGGRGKVAVTGELAGRAGQHPPGRLGNPGPAGQAGRGSATLIHQLQADPGHLGLVFQDGDQMADPPIAGALIVPPSRRKAQDAARVADGQGADPAGHRPGDHLPPGDTQPRPGSTAHHLRRAGYTASGHTQSTPAATDKPPSDTGTARTDAPMHRCTDAPMHRCTDAVPVTTTSGVRPRRPTRPPAPARPAGMTAGWAGSPAPSRPGSARTRPRS